MAIVFQYGSNCLDSEINSEERLCGDARFLDIAETVENFELAFDVWVQRPRMRRSGYRPKAGKKQVWGAIYEVPDDLIDRKSAKARCRKSFDAIEGKNYKREMIDVRRPDEQIVTALTYTVINPKPGLKTSEKYVGYIVAGLRSRGVSQAYIERVKSLAAANNSAISAVVDRL